MHFFYENTNSLNSLKGNLFTIRKSKQITLSLSPLTLISCGTVTHDSLPTTISYDTTTYSVSGRNIEIDNNSGKNLINLQEQNHASGYVVYSAEDNDTIIGSNQNDLISAGNGADSIFGKEGDDIFLFLGTFKEKQFSSNDYTFSKNDLSALLSQIPYFEKTSTIADINALNANTVEGDTGTDTIVTFGTIDFTNLYTKSIEKLYFDGTLSTTTNTLSQFSNVNGNNTSSKIFFTNSDIITDNNFSLTTLDDVSLIYFQTGTNFVFNNFLRTILTSVTYILNTGTITLTETDDLNYLKNKTFSTGTKIIDEQGNEIDYTAHNITFRTFAFDNNKTSVTSLTRTTIDYSALVLAQNANLPLNVSDVFFMGADKTIENDIISLYESFDDNNLFTLTNNTLTFIDLPEYINDKIYQIKLSAYDSNLDTEGTSHKYTFSINVIEQNDQTPTDLTFAYNSSLVKDNNVTLNTLPKKTILGTLSVTDVDTTNNNYNFSILSHNDDNYTFEFSDNSVLLTATNITNGEHSASITIRVEDTLHSGDIVTYDKNFDIQFSLFRSDSLITSVEGEDITFSINLAQAATEQIYIHYQTSSVKNFNNGYYNPGHETLSQYGHVVFNTGEITKNVTISNINDPYGFDAPDVFTLDLTTPEGVTATTEKAAFVLSDDSIHEHRHIDLSGQPTYTLNSRLTHTLKPNFNETHAVNITSKNLNLINLYIDFTHLWDSAPISATLDNYETYFQKTVQYFSYKTQETFNSYSDVISSINTIGNNLTLRFTQNTDFVISWIRNNNDLVFSRFKSNTDNFGTTTISHVRDTLVIEDIDNTNSIYVHRPQRYGTNNNDAVTLSIESLYFGLDGDDTITGDSSSELIYGGDGNDTINGNDGNELLIGDKGDDILIGGNNDDYLMGAKGQDTLTGGSGKDGYYFNAGDFDHDHKSDIITDFHYDDDFFVLNNLSIDNGDTHKLEIATLNASTQTSNNSLNISGTDIQHLNDADIIIYNNNNDGNGFLNAYEAYESLKTKLIDNLEINTLTTNVFFWENTDNKTVLTYLIDSGVTNDQIIAYDLATLNNITINDYTSNVKNTQFYFSDEDVIKKFLPSHDVYLRQAPSNTIINYSFTSVTNNNYSSISSENHKSVIKDILNEISMICNLTFVEDDTNTEIRFNLYDFGQNNSTYGETQYSYFITDSNAGHITDKTVIVLNKEKFGNLLTWNYHDDKNSSHESVYYTLIHEMLHALGAKHMRDYNGNVVTPLVSHYDDVGIKSTLSYQPSYGDYSPGTPMYLDIEFLQNYYGTNNNARTGNTRYGFNAADLAPADNPSYIKDIIPQSLNFGTSDNLNTFVSGSIWDGGGIDTLDASLYSMNQILSLNGYSSIGGEIDNVFIPVQSHIENAIGGAGNDKITGNYLNNRLDGQDGNDSFIGYGGSDVFTGGNGTDTFVFIDINDTQIDTITDFTIGNDLLDFTQMFTPNFLNTENLKDYISYTYNEIDNQTLISVNIEGSQTSLPEHDIVNLEGVNTITDDNLASLFYLT